MTDKELNQFEYIVENVKKMEQNYYVEIGYVQEDGKIMRYSCISCNSSMIQKVYFCLLSTIRKLESHMITVFDSAKFDEEIKN